MIQCSELPTLQSKFRIVSTTAAIRSRGISKLLKLFATKKSWRKNHQTPLRRLHVQNRKLRLRRRLTETESQDGKASLEKLFFGYRNVNKAMKNIQIQQMRRTIMFPISTRSSWSDPQYHKEEGTFGVRRLQNNRLYKLLISDVQYRTSKNSNLNKTYRLIYKVDLDECQTTVNNLSSNIKTKITE